MATPHDTLSMALFCDFENVALGVRDANFDKFDIKPILERLLLKGSIVVKKAYCDWDRYKTFKAAMHEANFELIEIPHVRQSGKNSADIRLVVDALDLCYTKAHVNTFVIISGDSDFSPLVSKLRENAKQVIGVGVKQSTSDLLIANCDEFIFYDDLVRETRRAEASREKNNKAQPSSKKQPDEGNRNKEELEVRKSEAIDMAIETFDALISERGDSGKIWASVLKNAIKRRKPDFNEGNYGFRTFGALLEEAQARGQLQLSRDDKSGTYVYRSNGPALASGNEAAEAAGINTSSTASGSPVAAANPSIAAPAAREDRNPRRNGRGNRNAPEKRPVAGTVPHADTAGTGVAVEAGADMLPPTSQAEQMPALQSTATSETAPATQAGADQQPQAAAARDMAEPAAADAAEHVAPPAATETPADTHGQQAAPVRHERGRRTQTGRRPVKSGGNKAKPAAGADSGTQSQPAVPQAHSTPPAANATAPADSTPVAAPTAPAPVAEAVPATQGPAAGDAPAAKKRTPRPARPRKAKTDTNPA